MTISQLKLAPLALFLLVGCSPGPSASTEPTAADNSTAKDNFSRSLTDAEKAKAGAAAAPTAPGKKPIGG